MVRKNSMFSLLLVGGTACLAGLTGCEKKEKVLDVETPGGEVEVTRDTDNGQVEVDVDTN